MGFPASVRRLYGRRSIPTNTNAAVQREGTFPFDGNESTVCGLAWPGLASAGRPARERVNFVTRATDEENLHPKDVLLSVPLVRSEGETSGGSVGFNGTDKAERRIRSLLSTPALVSPDEKRPLRIFDGGILGSGPAAISALEMNEPEAHSLPRGSFNPRATIGKVRIKDRERGGIIFGVSSLLFSEQLEAMDSPRGVGSRHFSRLSGRRWTRCATTV
ncbi:hypothetical protein K0M31_004687 [Melipona bicolor]|uniref:Uncharacterized protein n=1 Tax=Melipona bicolor TaxID=60889 RepID=A0AA40FXA7_9HYME|nr:hypothetical protein K0M31_004687 [Melipona bicolor]